jgi:hypothetical protein
LRAEKVELGEETVAVTNPTLSWDSDQPSAEKQKCQEMAIVVKISNLIT